MDLAPTAAVHAVNDQVPKLSLRRSSQSGAEWVTVQLKHQDVVTNQTRRTAVNELESVSKDGAVKSTTGISTRMAAETAVTGMFNALRATFGQPTPPLKAPASSTQIAPENPEKAAVTRNSSASRGLGLVKNTKN